MKFDEIERNSIKEKLKSLNFYDLIFLQEETDKEILVRTNKDPDKEHMEKVKQLEKKSVEFIASEIQMVCDCEGGLHNDSYTCQEPGCNDCIFDMMNDIQEKFCFVHGGL